MKNRLKLAGTFLRKEPLAAKRKWLSRKAVRRQIIATNTPWLLSICPAHNKHKKRAGFPALYLPPCHLGLDILCQV